MARRRSLGPVRLAQDRALQIGVAIGAHEVGETRRVEDMQPGAQRAGGICQIDPVEPSRHHDVGEQDVDLQIRIRQQQPVRVITAGGLEDPVAGALDHGERDLAHVAIVIDDKNGFYRLDHLPSTNATLKTARV